ncbi:unnamed protein product [Umbelopsis sp. WA50703]
MSTNTGTIHLDLQQLEEIQAQCEAMQDFSALNSLIQAVFTNPDQLSQSFVQTYDSDIRIDKPQVRQAYTLILHKCPEQVVDTLNRSVIQILDQIVQNKDAFNMTHIPLVVILFQHESLFEAQFGDIILTKLLDIFASISSDLQDALCESLTNASEDDEDSAMQDGALFKDTTEEYPNNQEIQQFQYLLDGLQSFICKRLRNKPTPDTTPNRDHAVINTTRCLAAFRKSFKQV